MCLASYDNIRIGALSLKKFLLLKGKGNLINLLPIGKSLTTECFFGMVSFAAFELHVMIFVCCEMGMTIVP